MNLRYWKSRAILHSAHGVYSRKGYEKKGAARTVIKVSVSDVNMMILFVIGSRVLGSLDDQKRILFHVK